MSALVVENLKKIYANGVQALRGIDFTVEKGDFFALLGPNGAGKSTTIGIITSLVNKTAGRVSVFDHDIDVDLRGAKSYIGLVPQEFNFNIFETVMQVIVNQAGYYGVPAAVALERAEWYLNKLGLWEKRNTQTRMLSGGMKRRLMIVRALLHEPELLILDEPTAGVDIELRRSMWDFLKEINERGKTIILTTHYLEEAEYLCRNIAIIDNGSLITHTNMRNLLDSLHVETFILYLEGHLHELPSLTGFNAYLIDSKTLAVDVAKEEEMNSLFQQLSEQGVHVLSMRNKANRLEELFIRMTAKEKTHD